MIKISLDATFKICLFGAGGVGKTSLTKRYMTGMFDMDTKITLGASINVKYLTINNKRISLQIWDFGGEEQFRFLLPVYAHGSSAAIFMFDTTRFNTFSNLDEWLEIFFTELSEEKRLMPIVMVGGKVDLVEKRSVIKEDAQKIADAHEFFKYVETSAKTGENVEDIFVLLAKEMLKKVNFS